MAKAKKLKSGAWRCLVYDYTDSFGKRHYKSFTADTKKNAELMAAKFAVDKEHFERIDDYTVGEAITRYISTKENVLSPSTIRGYNTLKNNSFHDISRIKLSKLTVSIVQNWINNLSVGHSPKTVRNANALLSSTLNMFYQGPPIKVTLPMPNPPELYTPSDTDIKKLLKHIEGTQLELAVLFGAFGAMRRGEIAALTHEDISGNTVVINKSLVRSPNGFIIKSPKTVSSYRSVEVPSFVIDKIPTGEGRIFTMHPEDISKKFAQAVRKAGLPHFRFHDLRHYSASIMHAMGIPDQYIMLRGGWKTDRVMKAVYRNAIGEENRKFVDKINGHFENMQHEMQHEN